MDVGNFQFPDLLLTQKDGFTRFENFYLPKLFEEVAPIEDIAGERLVLSISDLRIVRNFAANSDEISDAELDRIVNNCRKKELTFWWVINSKIELIDRSTGEVLYDGRANVGTMPLMTKSGTYIISGVENVIVNQIIRSYGIFYKFDKKDYSYSFQIIPQEGSWFSVAAEKTGQITIRINKSRKFPITALLRVFGFESDEQIKELFAGIFDEEDFDYITYTLKKDSTTSMQDAALFIYNKLRPGELVDVDNAIRYIRDLFESERIFLGSIARRKINAKIGITGKKDHNVIDVDDIVQAIKYLCHFANGKKWYFADDADHLSNKRIRTMGELLYAYLQPTMKRFQKNTRGKLSVLPLEQKILLREEQTEKKKDEIDELVSGMDDGEDAIEGAETSDIEEEEDEVKQKSDDDKLESLVGTVLMENVEFEEKVLIKKGTKITSSHLKLLKKHVIEYVMVRPQLKLVDVVNFKMIDSAIKSFFATSELSQFAANTNPIAETEHKRRITAGGPWGLKKQTAKFEVRDVHLSHYGRICPIETPEGQQIGLVIHQALYSRVNEDGFLETPAIKISRHITVSKDSLLHKILEEDIVDAKGKVLIAEGNYIDAKNIDLILETLKKINKTDLRVRPYVTKDVEYISPENDHQYTVGESTIKVDIHGNILEKRVPARGFDQFGPKIDVYHVNELTHIDLSPFQLFSPDAASIPFIDRDDADRALMAAAMQKQAVSLLKPQAPFVGTGVEKDIVRTSTSVVSAEGEGEVIYVGGKKSSNEQYGGIDYIIKIQYEKLDNKKNVIKEYNLQKYSMSNQKSLIHLRPRVTLGQMVKLGDILAEGQSVVWGELSLGTNLRVAFMPWGGYNYEDAIIISDRLVKDDNLTSVHIEKFEIEVSDTKLWPEQTTPDIPNVSMAKLKNLDENGIVRVGSIIKGGDILVGKISPKSEGELSAEEKLIQAVFGEKSKNVKDSSLYLPSGSEGKVLDVVVLDSKKGDNLMAGVKNKITVFVATNRKIEVGDKLVGRHGNKGIISVILPEEDMPYTADGEPVDVILNPLGVISRMNIGQVLENHMGLIAKLTWYNFAIPLFSGFSVDDVRHFFSGDLSDTDIAYLRKSGLSTDQIEDMIQLIKSADLPDDGKFDLYDGRNGDQFDQKVSVGYMYILKLEHMVEDKIHARAVGPYSLITQQPLSGKARDGWQRFGEMEVWALEAYGAVHTLQEMLTIKSDDIAGRNKTYESIIKGKKIQMYGIPESYYYLANMFKGLCQNIVPLSKEQMEKIRIERREKILKLWLKNLSNVGEAVSDEIHEDKTVGLIKKVIPGAEVDDIMTDIWSTEEEVDAE